MSSPENKDELMPLRRSTRKSVVAKTEDQIATPRKRRSITTPLKNVPEKIADSVGTPRRSTRKSLAEGFSTPKKTNGVCPEDTPTKKRATSPRKATLTNVSPIDNRTPRKSRGKEESKTNTVEASGNINITIEPGNNTRGRRKSVASSRNKPTDTNVADHSPETRIYGEGKSGSPVTTSLTSKSPSRKSVHFSSDINEHLIEPEDNTSPEDNYVQSKINKSISLESCLAVVPKVVFHDAKQIIKEANPAEILVDDSTGSPTKLCTAAVPDNSSLFDKDLLSPKNFLNSDDDSDTSAAVKSEMLQDNTNNMSTNIRNETDLSNSPGDNVRFNSPRRRLSYENKNNVDIPIKETSFVSNHFDMPEGNLLISNSKINSSSMPEMKLLPNQQLEIPDREESLVTDIDGRENQDSLKNVEFIKSANVLISDELVSEPVNKENKNVSNSSIISDNKPPSDIPNMSVGTSHLTEINESSLCSTTVSYEEHLDSEGTNLKLNAIAINLNHSPKLVHSQNHPENENNLVTKDEHIYSKPPSNEKSTEIRIKLVSESENLPNLDNSVLNNEEIKSELKVSSLFISHTQSKCKKQEDSDLANKFIIDSSSESPSKECIPGEINKQAPGSLDTLECVNEQVSQNTDNTESNVSSFPQFDENKIDVAIRNSEVYTEKWDSSYVLQKSKLISSLPDSDASNHSDRASREDSGQTSDKNNLNVVENKPVVKDVCNIEVNGLYSHKSKQANNEKGQEIIQVTLNELSPCEETTLSERNHICCINSDSILESSANSIEHSQAIPVNEENHLSELNITNSKDEVDKSYLFNINEKKLKKSGLDSPSTGFDVSTKTIHKSNQDSQQIVGTNIRRQLNNPKCKLESNNVPPVKNETEIFVSGSKESKEVNAEKIIIPESQTNIDSESEHCNLQNENFDSFNLKEGHLITSKFSSSADVDDPSDSSQQDYVQIINTDCQIQLNDNGNNKLNSTSVPSLLKDNLKIEPYSDKNKQIDCDTVRSVENGSCKSPTFVKHGITETKVAGYRLNANVQASSKVGIEKFTKAFDNSIEIDSTGIQVDQINVHSKSEIVDFEGKEALSDLIDSDYQHQLNKSNTALAYNGDLSDEKYTNIECNYNKRKQEDGAKEMIENRSSKSSVGRESVLADKNDSSSIAPEHGLKILNLSTDMPEEINSSILQEDQIKTDIESKIGDFRDKELSPCQYNLNENHSKTFNCISPRVDITTDSKCVSQQDSMHIMNSYHHDRLSKSNCEPAFSDNLLTREQTQSDYQEHVNKSDSQQALNDDVSGVKDIEVMKSDSGQNKQEDCAEGVLEISFSKKQMNTEKGSNFVDRGTLYSSEGSLVKSQKNVDYSEIVDGFKNQEDENEVNLENKLSTVECTADVLPCHFNLIEKCPRTNEFNSSIAFDVPPSSEICSKGIPEQVIAPNFQSQLDDSDSKPVFKNILAVDIVDGIIKSENTLELSVFAPNNKVETSNISQTEKSPIECSLINEETSQPPFLKNDELSGKVHSDQPSLIFDQDESKSSNNTQKEEIKLSSLPEKKTVEYKEVKHQVASKIVSEDLRKTQSVSDIKGDIFSDDKNKKLSRKINKKSQSCTNTKKKQFTKETDNLVRHEVNNGDLINKITQISSSKQSTFAIKGMSDDEFLDFVTTKEKSTLTSYNTEMKHCMISSDLSIKSSESFIDSKPQEHKRSCHIDSLHSLFNTTANEDHNQEWIPPRKKGKYSKTNRTHAVTKVYPQQLQSNITQPLIAAKQGFFLISHENGDKCSKTYEKSESLNAQNRFLITHLSNSVREPVGINLVPSGFVVTEFHESQVSGLRKPLICDNINAKEKLKIQVRSKHMSSKSETAKTKSLHHGTAVLPCRLKNKDILRAFEEVGIKDIGSIEHIRDKVVLIGFSSMKSMKRALTLYGQVKYKNEPIYVLAGNDTL